MEKKIISDKEAKSFIDILISAIEKKSNSKGKDVESLRIFNDLNKEDIDKELIEECIQELFDIRKVLGESLSPINNKVKLYFDSLLEGLGKVTNMFHDEQIELIKHFVSFNKKEISLDKLEDFLTFLQKYIIQGLIHERSKYVIYIRRIQKQSAEIINKAIKLNLTHVKIELNKKDLDTYTNLLNPSTGTFKRDMFKKLEGKKKLIKKEVKSKKKGLGCGKCGLKGLGCGDCKKCSLKGNYSEEEMEHTERNYPLYNKKEITKVLGNKRKETRSADWGGLDVWNVRNDGFNGHFVVIDDNGEILLMTRYFNEDTDDNDEEVIIQVEQEDTKGLTRLLKKALEIKNEKETLGKAIRRPKGTIISTDRAKKIASEWYEGDGSSLYQFSSSGIYSNSSFNRYIKEISDNIDEAQENNSHTKKDLTNLNELKKYFLYKYYEFKKDESSINGLGNAPTCIVENPKEIQRLTGNASGLVRADNRTVVSQANTIRLPKEIGKLLGNIEPHKYSIVLTGDAESGKTEFLTQLADTFIDSGRNVAFFSLEQGGVESKLTTDAIDRNVKKENQSKLFVSGVATNGIKSIEDATKTFDVIFVDSFGKLGVEPLKHFDLMRNNYPDKIWVFIFQQTAEGTARGGSSMGFDSPVVLKVNKVDHTFVNNFVEVIKNRGNSKDVHYNIASKKTFNTNKPSL